LADTSLNQRQVLQREKAFGRHRTNFTNQTADDFEDVQTVTVSRKASTKASNHGTISFSQIRKKLGLPGRRVGDLGFNTRSAEFLFHIVACSRVRFIGDCIDKPSNLTVDLVEFLLCPRRLHRNGQTRTVDLGRELKNFGMRSRHDSRR
jgi:hypothetical protein